MRVGDKQMLDEIPFLGLGPANPAPAAALAAIGVHGQALDVSLVRHRHHHVLLRDQRLPC